MYNRNGCSGGMLRAKTLRRRELSHGKKRSCDFYAGERAYLVRGFLWEGFSEADPDEPGESPL